QGQFQNIAPTGRSISNEGTAIYELKDGKIVSHQIQTDRLGFLQQLGILPNEVGGQSQEKDYVYFVDKFLVPKNAIEEFTQRMQYNRNLIKSLPGFIKDEAIAYRDTSGDLNLMTIAVWQNQEFLEKAKMFVQADYEKIHFNPGEFTRRLNIKMERQLYNAYAN
ncbi:MAG TPA: ester cyclase, partial [Chryseosolibacter sp.]|nr:ester cyclase [Chryseosolibacter sp.]